MALVTELLLLLERLLDALWTTIIQTPLHVLLTAASIFLLISLLLVRTTYFPLATSPRFRLHALGFYMLTVLNSFCPSSRPSSSSTSSRRSHAPSFRQKRHTVPQHPRVISHRHSHYRAGTIAG